MDSTDHLLWIDLETTGSDPELDQIIEVGGILTDMEQNIITTFQYVVKPDQFAMQRLMQNDFVRNMHEENGLLAEVGSAPFVGVVEGYILETLVSHGVEPGKVTLCGSGVGKFDSRFIENQMQTLHRMLTYYVIDVGIMRRFLRDVCGLPDVIPDDGDSSTKTHRAYDDICQHFNESKHYVALFRKVMKGAGFQKVLAGIKQLAGGIDLMKQEAGS